VNDIKDIETIIAIIEGGYTKKARKDFEGNAYNSIIIEGNGIKAIKILKYLDSQYDLRPHKGHDNRFKGYYNTFMRGFKWELRRLFAQKLNVS
jgi:hypothetical protein